MTTVVRVARVLLWVWILVFVLIGVGLAVSWSEPVTEGTRWIGLESGAAAVVGLVAQLLWHRRPAAACWLTIALALFCVRMGPLGYLSALFLFFVLFRRWQLLKETTPNLTKPENGLLPPGHSSYWVLVAFSVCAMIGTELVMFSLKERQAFPPPALFLASVLMALLTAPLLAQLGRLFIGVSVGLKPLAVAFGPFGWIRLAYGGRFLFGTGFSPWASQVSLGALDERGVLFRVSAMLAAGPASELTAALLAAVLFRVIDAERWPFVALSAGYFAMVTVVSAGYHLVPQTVGGRRSEGARLLALWQGRGAREVELARHLYSRPLLTPVSYQDLAEPPAAVSPADASFLSDSMVRYYRGLEFGDYGAAAVALEAALQTASTLKIRQAERSLAYEVAWFRAACQGDRNARAQMPANLRGWPVDDFVMHRAEAAMYRQEGRFADADAHFEAARELLDRCAETGWTQLNRELLLLTAVAVLVGPSPTPVLGGNAAAAAG